MSLKMLRFACVATATLFALALAPPQKAAAQITIVSESTPSVMRSHQFVLRSEKLAREFLVQVAEPAVAQPAGQKTPVVYALDGNIIFEQGTQMARALQSAGRMQPAYVVGIGYPTTSMQVVTQERIRDYMHTPVASRPGSGGGEAFQRFLLDELRPFLEARYPFDPKASIIAGNSLSGLFASAVLVRQPDAFSGYLVGSPSFELDPSPLASAKALRAGSGASKVYIAGSDEEASSAGAWWTDLNAALSTAGFKTEKRVFEDQTHSSVVVPAAMNGLPFLLPAQAR